MKKIPVRWIVLFILCILYFITYVDRVNLGTAAPMIRDEFQMSNTVLGIIFSAFAYPYAIFQIFGGRLADRYGAHKVLFVCCLITTIATILTGFATGVVSLFVCRLLLGCGEGATFPSATRAMQDWIPAKHRGLAQGVTHSFSRLGNSITPPLVALLMLLDGWRSAFFVLGACSFLWVIAWLFYFRDNPRDHKGVTPAELAVLPNYAENKKHAKKKVPWKRLSRRMLPVTVTYFCYGWCLWLFLNWLPSFFLSGYGLDIKKSAIFSAGVFFSGVVGDSLGGVWSDWLMERTRCVKKARLTVAVTSFLGAAVCLGFAMQAHTITPLAIFLSAGFFFLELNIGPLWSIPMDIAPQYAGAAAGMMNTGMAVAGIISPIVFGQLVDLFGSWFWPFLISVCLLVFGACMAFTTHPERRFEDPDTLHEADLASAKKASANA